MICVLFHFLAIDTGERWHPSSVTMISRALATIFTNMGANEIRISAGCGGGYAGVFLLASTWECFGEFKKSVHIFLILGPLPRYVESESLGWDLRIDLKTGNWNAASLALVCSLDLGNHCTRGCKAPSCTGVWFNSRNQFQLMWAPETAGL